MTWIDQSADGWIVEWREHVLGREMRFLLRDYLEYEPAAHDGAGLGARLAGVTVTPHGLQWPTGTWVRLKIAPILADGFPGLVRLGDHSVTPGVYELPWTKLPPCDAVEVTPVDPVGSHGVTTRVVRPLDLPWLPFRGRFENEPWPGLRLRPERRDGLDFDRVEMEAVPLRLVGRERFRALRPVPLPGGEGLLSINASFSGLVAIVGRAGALTRLLDCLTVAQGDVLPRPRSPREWQEARRLVRSADLAVSPWPARSAEPLAKILAEATAAGVPSHLRDEIRHIRAVHRHLVLRACGVEAGEPTEEAVLDLAAADSLRDLLGRRLTSKLLKRWEKIPDASGRAWVLRNAQDPDLHELLDWAADAGGSGLDLARRLLPIRRRLRELVADGRWGSEDREAISSLQEELERAPDRLEKPQDLERRLREIEAKAAPAEGA